MYNKCVQHIIFLSLFSGAKTIIQLCPTQKDAAVPNPSKSKIKLIQASVPDNSKRTFASLTMRSPSSHSSTLSLRAERHGAEGKALSECRCTGLPPRLLHLTRTSRNIPTHLASGKGFLGLSWWASAGRCHCCFQESWGSCYWGSEGTDGCWVAGKNPEKWRWVACEAHFVLSYGTELTGCAEDYIRCVLEPALEEELEKGKEKQETNMKMMKICSKVTISPARLPTWAKPFFTQE